MNKNLILLFHRPLSEEWFRKTLLTIGKIYNFVTLDEVEKLYYEDYRSRRFCHITFDDGHTDVYNFAFPVLKELGIPATLFVSPQIISEKRNYWFQQIEDVPADKLLRVTLPYFDAAIRDELSQFPVMELLKSLPFPVIQRIADSFVTPQPDAQNISSDQLKEMSESGVFTFGAHTVQHPILSNETAEMSKFNIRESVELLTKITGKETRSFAYPNGMFRLDYRERELAYLKESNVKLAFTTQYKFMNASDNPLEIPRMEINNGGAGKIFIKTYIAPWVQEKYLNVKKGSSWYYRKKIQELLKG